MIAIRYQGGIELPGHSLWLDPHGRREFAFVSHAHGDHLGAHAEVIGTKATLALMRSRVKGRRIEQTMEYGERRIFRGAAVTLLPAGHILGSAQSFVESDRGTLLYTGDFKLRPSLAAEPAEWRKADTLIMETTFGLPRYAMPPTAETLAAMIAFCREALVDGVLPVLLGYSLGKAQEILCAVLAAGLTPMLHDSEWALTKFYREHCPGFPEGYVRFDADFVEGHVLICPPGAVRGRWFSELPRRRVAVLTGWALDRGATYRYGSDAAFPLTDHADYPDLLRYVELVQPQRVFTVHGFAEEFAADLRARGIEAWALGKANQLELGLG